MTPRRRGGTHGFVLVTVLWILAAVSALVLVHHAYVVGSAVSVGDAAARVQDRALLTAAVELAAYQLLADPPDEREATRTFSGMIGDARLTVTTVSETARVDLNAAPSELLAGLIAALGPGRAEARTMAERIVGWRSPRDAIGDDPEDERYRVAGLNYLPRHAPFAHVEELRLVHGLPAALVDRLTPLVTLFSAQPAINLIESSPQVLAALPGNTPERLAILLNAREDPLLSPPELLALAGDDAALVTLAHAAAWRIAVTIERGARRWQPSAVVLLTGDGREPYRWLARFDNIDAEKP